MIKEMLKERNIPQLKSREEMLEILQREEYGYMPPLPESISFKEEVELKNFCAGKSVLERVEISVKLYGEDFTFPAYVAIPKKEGKQPFFISIGFRGDIADRYIPIEEIIDEGFGALVFCYEDVTSDDGDFNNGLAGIITRHMGRGAATPGKIAMWAWAAQRVMDYAATRSDLDMEHAMVCGHSRLGKTALLCAATDERFFLGHSNDSGCSGAAITRGKVGENNEAIIRVFPYWFCENYFKYSENEDKMPFDQHWLIAASAPRRIYVASAIEDEWADPDSEYLGCVAASPAYEALGLKGFVGLDRLPRVDDVFHEGEIGYHLRKGTHYFGREDWQKLIAYVKKHM